MDDTILYNAKDIQGIFRVGKSKAYEIINAKGFPKIKIGKQFYIPKNDLDNWLTHNLNNSILL